jgi:hypothetical protein
VRPHHSSPAPALPSGVAKRENPLIMHRLRTTWLALAGGALLVTLSVSTAFGAPPEKDGPPGHKVSGFVHELIFGSEEETDEDEVVEEEPADEDEDGSEEDENSDEDESTDDDEDVSEDDEDTDEAVDEDGEEAADRQVPEEFANHGECVSAAAHDTEGFEESESANKGEWVSMHARYVCWGLDVPGEESEEDVDDEDSTTDEDEDADEEDADEASAKEQAKADRAAARAERKAARAAAREERAAARAERHFANAANRGGGKGRGH